MIPVTNEGRILMSGVTFHPEKGPSYRNYNDRDREFVWHCARGENLFGWIEERDGENGTVVQSTKGWYLTSIPMCAAEAAGLKAPYKRLQLGTAQIKITLQDSKIVVENGFHPEVLGTLHEAAEGTWNEIAGFLRGIGAMDEDK